MCATWRLHLRTIGCDLGGTSSVPSLLDRRSCGALLRTRREDRVSSLCD